MSDRRPLLGLLGLWLAWGSSFLAIRVMVHSIPPLFGAGIAFTTAGLALALVAILTGRATLDRAGLQSAGVGGLLLLVGGQGLLTVAEQELASGTAAVVVAAIPLWVVLLGALTGDPPGWAGTARTTVGFVGVAVLLLGSAVTGGGAPWALAVVLVASLSWAVGSFVGARARRSSTPVIMLASVQTLVGGVVLLGLGLALGPAPNYSAVTTSSVTGLIYLATVDALLGFLLYQWLLRTLPIALVSTYAYVVPLVAVALGVVLLDEQLTPLTVAGAAVVVVSVAAETRATRL